MSDYTARWRIEGENGMQSAFRSILSDAKTTSDQMTRVFRSAFAGLSIAGVAAGLGRAVGGAIEFGDSIGKAAVKAGLGAEAMSELAHAATTVDLDLATLSMSLQKMQVFMSNASSGGKAQAETLAALGLSVRQLQSLAPDQQFEQFAESIKSLKDPTDRARAAVDVFGKSGAELLPLFDQGAAGIRHAREEAHALGKVLNDEAVQSLQNADDALKRMKASSESLGLTLATKLSPAIVAGSTFLRQLIGGATPLEDLTAKVRHLNQEIANTTNRTDAEGLAYRKDLEERRAAIAKQLKFYEDAAVAAHKAAAAPGNLVAAPGFAKATGPVEIPLEVRITSKKIEFTAMQRFYQDLQRDTETSIEKQVSSFEELRSKLNVLFRDGLIDTKTYSARISEAVDDVLKPIEVSSKKIVLDVKSATNEMSVYAEEAARNMQDAFANFLFDPFSGGLKGMLRGFIDVIRRMVAEAAAAKIFDALKGAGGGGGIGGFLGSVLGGLFKADGGPVTGGRPYIVGEEGPELFVPNGSGTVVPNRQVATSAGRSITIHNTIDARGSGISRAELNAALTQTSEVTVARVRELVAAGRI